MQARLSSVSAALDCSGRTLWPCSILRLLLWVVRVQPTSFRFTFLLFLVDPLQDCNLLLSDEVSSRCYPYVETGDGGLPGRTHLLCLKCHLARIGATPAPGQNLEVLLQGRSSGGSQRRGSNGSASLTSSTLSCDMGTGGGLNSGGGGAAPSTPTYGSKSILTSPGGRSSPFSTERRVISKPWLQGGRSGYYGEGDGR